MLRDASGNISDMMTGNNTDDCVGLGCAHGWNFTKCIQLENCEYGLNTNTKVSFNPKLQNRNIHRAYLFCKIEQFS